LRPRVLFVGRTRYRLPLDAALRRKFDTLAHEVDVRVLASAPAGAPTGDGTFTLVPPLRARTLDGVAFHGLLPFRVAREIRRFRPTAIIVQGAHEGALTIAGRALSRTRVPIVVDVHGDWRTATRLYGSPLRRGLNPVADRVARWAVRHADAVRTVTAFTTELVRAEGVEPAATFPAFMDLVPFLGEPAPLPDRPVALFVGVLELYKGIDVLASAWPKVAERVPGAELRLVGRGPRADLAEQLARRPDVIWREQLSTEEVARELDAATCLVLPSRGEGMGRVVVEALCRGRPVVGSDSGGIRDLVTDGHNGLLVRTGDATALADALARMLADPAPLAARARPSVEPFLATPEEYAERVRSLAASLEAVPE
jgi:glycosyltransferase involved in cell wall biosynthesis